jgi:integrase
MSVYKRKNSKFYYCEITINGKTVIRSTKTVKKSAALRFESQLRELLYRQQVLGDKPTISISDAILEYSRTKQGSVNKRNLTTQITALETQLTRVFSLTNAINQLNGGHLTKLVTLRRQDGVAEGTIRLMLTTLKCVINWSNGAGYLQPENITIPKIRVNNQRTRILTVKEETDLLSLLKTHKNPDDYDLVVLLLDSAARLNEIQQLSWDSVDLESREIRLWRTKTSTESVITLTNRSYEVLLNRSNTKTSTLVFPSSNGGLRRTTPKTIQNAYKALGLDNFCTHSIRHSTASKLVKSGMSLFAVSQLLGHSNISMSQRYSHLEQSAVANQAAEILNRSNT